MNKVMTIIAIVALAVPAVANDKTEDKGMKVPEMKVGFKMDSNKGIEARAGFDLFDLFGTKTKVSPVDIVTSTGGSEKTGMFAGMGSWISDNPWKSALITGLIIYGGYELSQSGSGGKGAKAGQGGTASNQAINLANNSGTINFNYTGDDSSGQSGRDTVPFVEEVVEE